MIGGTIVSNARLMKPLFYDGNFNRDGKKMRAVFEREISDGTVSYRLWRSDGKPDIQYPRAENDNYLLYAEIRDYLVPLRITDFYLIDHAGYPAAVAELYGNKDARNDYFDNLRKSGDDAVLAISSSFIVIILHRTRQCLTSCAPVNTAHHRSHFLKPNQIDFIVIAGRGQFRWWENVILRNKCRIEDGKFFLPSGLVKLKVGLNLNVLGRRTSHTYLLVRPSRLGADRTAAVTAAKMLVGNLYDEFSLPKIVIPDEVVSLCGVFNVLF